MNILVLAAHPDDEVLGCGGTIARCAAEGHDVAIAILGEGITSRYTSRDDPDPSLVAELSVDSERVGDLLGAREVTLYGLPDNRFDTVAMLDVVKIIEELVDKYQPQVVYTQHGGDLNVDHQILYRATLTATRPLQGSAVKTVYAYEVASSTEWAFQNFEPVFHPTTFVDITDTIDKKIEGMQMYETEARSFPHPRSPEALRAAAQHWGSVAGFSAAEVFDLVRDLR